MKFQMIKKNVRLVSCVVNGNGLYATYLFKGEEVNIVAGIEDLDEYLLEVIGEDLETATAETGAICQFDALSICIYNEEQRENKKEAMTFVDSLISNIKDINNK